MKKLAMFLLVVVMAVSLLFAGCTQAERVSQSVSAQADNFNVVRRITVINTRTDDIMFTLTGKMSLQNTDQEDELSLIVEDENGIYHKHFIYLNDWTTYIVEDLGGADVNKYKYTLNFNPKMWIPVEFKTVD